MEHAISGTVSDFYRILEEIYVIKSHSISHSFTTISQIIIVWETQSGFRVPLAFLPESNSVPPLSNPFVTHDNPSVDVVELTMFLPLPSFLTLRSLLPALGCPSVSVFLSVHCPWFCPFRNSITTSAYGSHARPFSFSVCLSFSLSLFWQKDRQKREKNVVELMEDYDQL